MRNKIIVIFFCLFTLCTISCKSTVVQSDGATTSGIRDVLEHLESEQSTTAITSAKIEDGIEKLERTVDEGKEAIEGIQQILCRIRSQVIEGTPDPGRTE